MKNEWCYMLLISSDMEQLFLKFGRFQKLIIKKQFWISFIIFQMQKWTFQTKTSDALGSTQPLVGWGTDSSNTEREDIYCAPTENKTHCMANSGASTCVLPILGEFIYPLVHLPLVHIPLVHLPQVHLPYQFIYLPDHLPTS